MRELYLLPDSERLLFSGVDTRVTPDSEFSTSFQIRSRSRARRETHSVSGASSAGPTTVRLSYTNDYWEPPDNDRNVRLDRLDVRNAAGSVVASRELENLERLSNCNHPVDDHFALHCEGSLLVPLDIPAAGDYRIEVVAWADQAGDEYPRLGVTVESDPHDSTGANAIPKQARGAAREAARSPMSRPTPRTWRPRTGYSSTFGSESAPRRGRSLGSGGVCDAIMEPTFTCGGRHPGRCRGGARGRRLAVVRVRLGPCRRLHGRHRLVGPLTTPRRPGWRCSRT